MVKVTIAGAIPGVTGFLSKAAVECTGKPVTLNMTGFANPWAVGVTVILIATDWPAVTDGGFAGPLTA